MDELELLKLKIETEELRFNPNHDGKTGRFTGKGGSGGIAIQIQALEAQKAGLSRFGEGAKKRAEIQKQIDELKAQEEPVEAKPQRPQPVQQTTAVEKGYPVTPEKEAQFKVIEENNAMTDDVHTGIRKPSDIKSPAEAFKTTIDEDSDYLYPDFTKADGEKALSTGKITVYSSKPIDQGGFISPSKMMASDYAGGGKVYSQVVDINDVAWIDSNEGQMAKITRGEIMDELEKRSSLCEVTSAEEDGKHIIVGRPIVYNSRTNIGEFDEVIESGALSKTDLKDVRFIVNHDTSKIPLARSRRNNGNSTMKLTHDEQGLLVEAELDTENNAEARALYSAVKRGDITGMSFMFSVPKGGDDWENLGTERPTRHIRSIGSVVEVSAVTFPAYGDTVISARSAETLENARTTLKEAEQDAELELLKEKTRAILF